MPIALDLRVSREITRFPRWRAPCSRHDVPPKPHRPFAPRKLLVAAVGVASINYVAIACGGATDGPATAGNLAAPPTSGVPDGRITPPTSGNLPAPPPPDAAADAPDANDASIDGNGDGGDAGADG
jgi:hypothetical protein